MIRRGKSRAGNGQAGGFYQKRQGANNNNQSSGVYGIPSGNHAQQVMQSHLNRAIAYDSNAKQGGANNAPILKNNIKDVMNTSAPICISSYIKGN